MASSSPKGRDLDKNPQEMGCHGNGPPARTNQEFVRRLGPEEGQTGKNSKGHLELRTCEAAAGRTRACSSTTGVAHDVAKEKEKQASETLTELAVGAGGEPRQLRLTVAYAGG